jgi:outer membrane protein assembly factor BamB
LGAWILVAIPQSTPPIGQNPPTTAPAGKSGKTVPNGPAPPFRLAWNLALPSATRALLAAGDANFFVGLDSGRLLAYTLADAREVWSADVQAALPPVTGDGLVYVVEDESVRALDQATGAGRWTSPVGSQAVAPTWRAGWLFTASRAGVVSGWRASDGARIWQQTLGAPASASMAVDGDRLIVPLADQRLVALAVADGATIWSIRLDGVGGQPLAAGDRIYLGAADYSLFSIKEDDGAMEWRHRLIRSTVVGHPVLDARHIWLATLDNRVEALSRGNGEIEWMNTLPGRPAEQLAIDEGEVIVPLSTGELAFFSQRDGKRMRPQAAVPGREGAPARGGTPGREGARGRGAPAGAAANPSAPAGAPAAAPPGPTSAIGALLRALLPGTRLVPPLVLTGSGDARWLLRVTLGSDDVMTVAAFEREKKDPTPPPGSQAPTPAVRP